MYICAHMHTHTRTHTYTQPATCVKVSVWLRTRGVRPGVFCRQQRTRCLPVAKVETTSKCFCALRVPGVRFTSFLVVRADHQRGDPERRPAWGGVDKWGLIIKTHLLLARPFAGSSDRGAWGVLGCWRHPFLGKSLP